MKTRRELLNYVLRHDLASFIHRVQQITSPENGYRDNWHIELLADRLQQVLDGRITRLLVTLPPRHLKSICASVAFPAFVLGHQPGKRLICASYSSELAAKHARDFRLVLASRSYREVFPKTAIDPQKNTELEIGTTARGFRLSTSVGGTLTGRGGDILIIDDPLKADEAHSETARNQVREWFSVAALSRLDDKERGAVIVVMQRLHADDLVGWLLERNPEGWVHVSLPAIAEGDERFELEDGHIVGRREGEALHPAHESRAALERTKRDAGSYVFEAQYQQNPLPLEGGLIKWSWFRVYDVPPRRQPGDRIVQSWDTASKATELSDFSVCTTWLRRGADHYLLDVFRRRLEFPALKQRVVQHATLWNADVTLIEDKGSGMSLIQELRAGSEVRPIAIEPEKDKVTRMHAETAKLEAGCVFIPRQAEWLHEFQRELLQFPRSRHDDQVDSVSQYLRWGTDVPLEDHHFAAFGRSKVLEEWASFDPWAEPAPRRGVDYDDDEPTEIERV